MAAADASSSVGASGSSVYAVSQEKTNGTRLARLLVDVGTHVLRKVLHSVHPTPATLRHVLNNNFGKLQTLRSRRVIFDDQWEKLFPSSRDPPDSKTFDITLLHLLLREICNLTAPPTTGWHKMPADGDVSREANIVRIKCFRNDLCHSVSTGIANDKFENKWTIVSSALVALGIDQTELDRLKTAPIDHDTERRIEEEVNKWKLEFEPRVETLEKKVQKLESGNWRSQAFLELRSCLPDKLPGERMFGRTQEINEVKDFVQSGNAAVVVITGGPGFGKTTVAKEVAHKLAWNSGNERAVFFCRLRTKRNVSEVAIEMIDSCDRIHTHVPENPARWLKEWSKQIETQVTFVLDNADDVLESEDRSSFLEMLSAVRMLSRENVTFVVTSRKTFNNDDLHPKVVRLKQVSVEDAKNILITQASNEDFQPKLSKPERIVELCGGVPLALCIVGSLLSDNTEEELIERLEKELLTALDDGETSMENVIRTSFDLLMRAKQDAFILMSVFPGQFNTAAAEAVMKACSVSRFDLILRSLKTRSLLEQPSSGRYQMHPLIQAFAKKIGVAQYPHLVAAGEKLACAHFLSRLAENGNKYWSKDGCRQSVDAFNADRNNFEYFLDIYAQGREKKDGDIMESCQTFLRDFPQMCMYLEMCVLPRFYISLLERLLKTFDSETQPVHKMELFCLLGHEVRKVGDTAKYNDYMEEAKKLYEEKGAETNPLSQVIYLNSFAGFLRRKNQKRKEVSNKAKEAYLKSLQICDEKLPEHPERAATLLFARGLYKTKQEKTEAGQKIKQAWQLFNKCLGEHFMTAVCLKHFADFHVFENETEALSYYQQALEMLKKLGLDGRKESILTLKNYGICHKNKGNFEEARNLLEKAERVAERELDEDHMWKVRVKTEQALLYEEEGNFDQMEKAMKEGLKMLYRLGQTLERLGSKHQIRKILKDNPQLFPEEQYPR